MDTHSTQCIKTIIDEQKICKYCLEPENILNCNLVYPCKCTSGVCQDCFNKHTSNSHTTICEICLIKYDVTVLPIGSLDTVSSTGPRAHLYHIPHIPTGSTSIQSALDVSNVNVYDSNQYSTEHYDTIFSGSNYSSTSATINRIGIDSASHHTPDNSYCCRDRSDEYNYSKHLIIYICCFIVIAIIIFTFVRTFDKAIPV
jgi:hypothetical protein